MWLKRLIGSLYNPKQIKGYIMEPEVVIWVPMYCLQVLLCESSLPSAVEAALQWSDAQGTADSGQQTAWWPWDGLWDTY